jgi:23S rRNA pseudouridine2605 synthase
VGALLSTSLTTRVVLHLRLEYRPAMRRTKATHTPLARLLSKLGLASRTQAVALVRAGRVSIGGSQINDPDWWAPRDALIRIDGKTVPAAPPSLRVLMLHKRRGYITARVDASRPVVCDHPHVADSGCMPIGRLDRPSEGLLLFTNDSLLANAVACPDSHLRKTYYVRVQRPLHSDELAALGDPSETSLGGELTLPSWWASMASERNANWCRVVLQEGKNRQIRRMLQQLGVGVQRLVRVSVGPIELGALYRGAVRDLDANEVARLRRAVGYEPRM